MLKNMKIGIRLAIGFCTTLILLIIVTAISMNRIKQINGDIRSLVQQDFPKTVIANSMINAVSVNGRILRNAYIFKDAEVQKELDRLPEQRKPCITQHHLCLLHPFFHLVNFPSLRAQVFARRQAFEAFFGTCNRFLGALMQSGPTALATTSAAPSTNCPAQTRCATAARSSSDPGSAL